MTKNFIEICNNKVYIQGDSFDEICKPVREYYWPGFHISWLEKAYQSYFINCGDGNNKIFGGPKDDCLQGGPGNNKYYITKMLEFENHSGSGITKIGDDIILNFKPYDPHTHKGDKLVITEVLQGYYISVTAIFKALIEDTDGVIIPFGNTGSVQLAGITKEQLMEHPSSFEFVIG